MAAQTETGILGRKGQITRRGKARLDAYDTRETSQMPSPMASYSLR